MITKNTLPFVCLIVLLTGIVIADHDTCIPGCCNGVLKDTSSVVKGTFSDWKFYADGTTEGSWTYNDPAGMVVSDDAEGTYTYDPSGPSSVATYTGTATIPSVPMAGTSTYTMTLTLTFPSPDYCIGGWTVTFDNPLWPPFLEGLWEHTSTCASSMAGHVDKILIDSGLDESFNFPGYISHNFDIEIETDDTVESITFTSPTTPGVASGITFTITKQGYNDPDENIDAGYEYFADTGKHEWWYFQGADNPATLSKYGNGWYDITVNYTAGGSDSTKIWFHLLAEDSPIPQPTQIPNLTSHSNRQRTESPITLQWDSCTDPNVKDIWIGFEKMPESIDTDIILPTSAVTTDPIVLEDSYWEAMIGFDHFYNFAHNADGVPYEVGRYAEKGYLIGIGIVSEFAGGGVVDSDELSVLALQWLKSGCDDWNDYCNKADVNYDYHVNLDDFKDISIDWKK